MERYTTNTMTIERKGIFDKNRKKRFELTFTCKDSKQKKRILAIGLNRGRVQCLCGVLSG